MPVPNSLRVQKRRDAMRRQGLRPVQIWVPDSRRPEFLAECRRQSLLIAEADQKDQDLGVFLDESLASIAGYAD
jgi:hypothetical protein